VGVITSHHITSHHTTSHHNHITSPSHHITSHHLQLLQLEERPSLVSQLPAEPLLAPPSPPHHTHHTCLHCVMPDFGLLWSILENTHTASPECCCHLPLPWMMPMSPPPPPTHHNDVFKKMSHTNTHTLSISVKAAPARPTKPGCARESTAPTRTWLVPGAACAVTLHGHHPGPPTPPPPHTQFLGLSHKGGSIRCVCEGWCSLMTFAGC